MRPSTSKRGPLWCAIFLLSSCLPALFMGPLLTVPVLGIEASASTHAANTIRGLDTSSLVPLACSIAPGANSSYPQVFEAAYNRQGGEPNMGCAQNEAHWWEGLVIQDFAGGAYDRPAIFHDENQQASLAYVLWGPILGRYWQNSSWGPPLSDVRNAWSSPQGTEGQLADFWDMQVYAANGNAWVVRGVTKDKYNALNGSGGFLGFPTDDGRPAVDSAWTTGGWYQTFEGGTIHTYSRDEQWVAYETHGAILSKYNSMGGSGSAVGYPVNDVETATQSDHGTTGQMARFEDGDIYTSTKGTYVIRGVSKDKFNVIGGTGGVLGFPTMDGAPARDSSWTTGGWYQWFEGGMLHTYEKNGQWSAYETHGAILEKYNNMGGSASAVGFPINDIEIATPSPNGTTGEMARFEDGDVYSSNKGTWVVRGITKDKYDSLGGSGGYLGFPENDGQLAATSPTGAWGYYQPFTGGIMHTYEKAGAWQAFPVHGAIQAKYNSIGGSGSDLGFPVNDEADTAVSPLGTQGRYQNFERGQIYYHSTGTFTGASFVVKGIYHTAFDREGGSGGWLGLPVSDELDCRMLFEQGYIDCNGVAHLDPQTMKAKVATEAEYIFSAQYRNPGHPADGALNNVAQHDAGWTWVVPRENAMAILGLILATEITGNQEYRRAADRTGDFLVRVQNEEDGAWFNQYSYATPVDEGRSPTHTAEVMIALYKLGFQEDRWDAMRKGAEYLLECQKVENKTGNDDGLVAGGKDAAGNYMTDRWTQDNAFAYQALRGAADWAEQKDDPELKLRFANAADSIRRGINFYLYDGDEQIWHKYIESDGDPHDSPHEWGNYAPQMLDLPPENGDGTGTTGVGDAAVGTWIHDTLGHDPGAVKQDDQTNPARLSPGFSFQAALVWLDLEQESYADDALEWTANSGLWCLGCTPSGGWIDWEDETGLRAEDWQRFIDTSFYAIAAWNGGYDFRTAEGSPVVDYGGAPSPFMDLPISYNQSPESFARILRNWNDPLGEGKITSWFDHHYPNYQTDDRMQLFNETYDENLTLKSGGLRCFDSWCYDGHNALDFAMTGDALAAASGTVVEVWPSSSISAPCGPSYGNYVVIYHTVDVGNGYFTRYAHLNEVYVSEGATVQRGDPVGEIGGTPNWAVHLHFGVYRDNGNGVWDCLHGQESDPGPDKAVDPFEWQSSHKQDPWVANRGGPSSYRLWIHEFTRVAAASSQPTTLTDATGSVTLLIPGGALAPSTSLALTSQPGPAASGDQRTTGHTFLTSLQESATAATRPLSLNQMILLTDPITIEVAYEQASVAHLDDTRLALHLWDEIQHQWTQLPSVVDPVQRRVTSLTSAFGQFDLQAPLRCAESSEPNDGVPRSQRIWPNDGPVRRSLDSFSDTDWWQFYAMQGQTYVIRTSRLAFGVDTVLNLYDHNGIQLLASNDNTGTGPESEISWQAPASGTYFVEVRAASVSAAGCTAEYDFDIAPNFGPLISIALSAYDLHINWQHDPQFAGYYVFGDSAPYLSANDVPDQSDYIPSSTSDTEFLYPQPLASLPEQYYYVIAPSDTSGEPLSTAGRVGKFTFGLVTGPTSPPDSEIKMRGSEFCSGLSVEAMASASFRITAICGQAGILLDSNTSTSPSYRHQPSLPGILP